MDPEEQGKKGFMDIAVDLKIPDRVKVKHRSITLRSISTECPSWKQYASK
jgi:hypothetical protein